MNDPRPVSGPRLVHWTVADIDAAIPAIRGKRDAALDRGDMAQAGIHDAWMNRLLDARPFHAATESAR